MENIIFEKWRLSTCKKVRTEPALLETGNYEK